MNSIIGFITKGLTVVMGGCLSLSQLCVLGVVMTGEDIWEVHGDGETTVTRFQGTVSRGITKTAIL